MFETIIPQAWLANILSEQMPDNIKFRLNSQGSMTEFLTQASQDKLAVKLFNSQNISADNIQNLPVSMALEQKYYLREVGLYCGENLCLLGRTVINQQNKQALNIIRNLGVKPLGNWLFKQSNIKRQGMWFARLDNYPLSSLKQLVPENPESIWVRCSRFANQSTEIFVIEWFLPNFWELEDAQSQTI